MKTQVTEFGFEVLVTYLLPGILATLAVFAWHGVGVAEAKQILDWAQQAQFLASLLMLSLFTLFGALIASLQALLESWILDRLTPWLMNKAPGHFDREWDYFINRLPTNSYISRVVLFFQFETRLGLASLILGITLLSLSLLHGVLFIVLGFVFYLIGIGHHRELASIRESYFQEQG